jgi:pimeloyl-ACP methyl ester carboxylesterase
MGRRAKSRHLKTDSETGAIVTDKTPKGTAYTVHGDGPPVVLIHGMGLTHAMWDWQLPPLLERFTVIRYDLLGHGESVARPCRYDMEDFVGQLHELLDHLAVNRAAIAGFSLGGLIVRAFALAHPDRCTAIAILNSAHDRTDEERAAMRKRLAIAHEQGPAPTIDVALARWFTKEFAAANPDVLDRVRRWMEANDPKVYPEIYRVLTESDAPLATSIAEIRCPTLVLACAEDHGNSPDMAHRMAALIPNAEVAIIPKLKHMALAEDPAAVSGPLIAFLERTAGQAK